MGNSQLRWRKRGMIKATKSLKRQKNIGSKNLSEEISLGH